MGRDGRIYVAGGLIYAWGGVSRFDNGTSAEVYDLATNTWAAAPSTNIPHVQGGGAASGGAIYAIATRFALNAATVESLALPGVLTLSTTSGPPGTKVRVKGTGFVAGETIAITFDDSPLSTAKASYRGWLSKSITVPAGATAGPHTITATGGTSGFTSQATFTVA